MEKGPPFGFPKKGQMTWLVMSYELQIISRIKLLDLFSVQKL